MVHSVILHQLVAKDPEKLGLTPDLARATLRLATSRDRYISLLGRFILLEMSSGIYMKGGTGEVKENLGSYWVKTARSVHFTVTSSACLW